METGTTASPPSYAEAISDTADDLLQPVILVLDNQSIHAEPDPAVHLYEVNRGIAHLGPATRKVEFTRIERSASARQRSRHIYDLHRTPRPWRVPSTRHAEYFIEAVAAPARRLGHLGLKTDRALATHWIALSVDMKGWTELLMPPFVADATPIFEVRHRQGIIKWMDGNGQDVAIEYDSDRELRLLVTASLRREMLDALVALWCCRMWQHSVDQHWAQTVLTSGWKHLIV